MRQNIFTSIAGMILFALMTCSCGNSSSVLFASEESKNSKLQPVYNEIKFFPGWDRDIWMMNQSHHGRFAAPEKWDRLAIVIDKKTSPYKAKFYQLEKGALIWQDDLPSKKIEFSVSCLICHNNGPRAIRAMSADPEAPLSYKDRFKMAVWNFRIKSYGRINYDSSHDSEDKRLKTPFRHRTPEATKELKVATCLYCHKEKGFLARGALQRQQMATIESLVSRGEMPPWGLKLSPKEQQELQDFLRGF